MSEYQYYEFLAVDHPLDARQQAEVRALSTEDHLIVDLASEDDSGEWVEDALGSLSAIVGVRGEIAAGDLRPRYLARLAGYGTRERDEHAFDRDEEDRLEPRVPPGLSNLTTSQQALADLLRLDRDLLDVAATASPSWRSPQDPIHR